MCEPVSLLILLSYAIFSFYFNSNSKLEVGVFSEKLPFPMTMVRPPPDSRTNAPITFLPFLLHAENDSLATEAVGSIGFNEFLQYASFHELLLIIYIISS